MCDWVRLVRTLAAALLIGVTCTAASAQRSYPERIAQLEFVLDNAGMLQLEDVQAIRGLCEALLEEKDIPIVVVTIESLATYGAGDLSIEQYARGLFDDWGIGREDYNCGVLFLIAKGNRRARIELGAAWGYAYDETSQSIMDDLIVPEFKADRFSAGIRLGVEGLERMARGEALPKRPIGSRVGNALSSVWKTVVDTVKRAMQCLMVPLFFLMAILGKASGYDSDGSGGGSFGGGSFGGGFSGGGGASGSW